MGIAIANIVAIFRKELQGYFASPLAYSVAGIFWLMSGFMFVLILLSPEGIIQQVAARDQLGVPTPPVDVAYEFQRTFLSVMGSISLLLLPMLSMGLYSEERKRGTLELLATSPITNWAVAVGKLLGVLTFFTVMVLPLLVYEIVTLSAADPPISFALPVVAHIGWILLAAAVLSLGMFISSLTESTILAAVLTFVLNFFLWVAIDWAANAGEGTLSEIFRHFSLQEHYNNLVQGTFATSSLIVFASYIILGIFLTAQSIDALRFQQS
jgi:ABC-2 type transport system permease protein